MYKKNLHELIDCLAEDDCKRIFAFLYSVYFMKESDTIYFFGMNKEIWKSKIF